jgi:hypothetical protein
MRQPHQDSQHQTTNEGNKVKMVHDTANLTGQQQKADEDCVMEKTVEALT